MALAINIAILANAQKAKAELQSVATTAQRVGDGFRKMAAPATVALGGIGVLAKGAAQAASDAEQSLGGTEAIFGKFADTVIKTSGDAAQRFGLSANEYRDSANLIGALLKNQGVSMGDLAGKTDQLVARGADLAAMFGGTASDAVGALTAAFKGEFDSLDKYGITMTAAKVSTEAGALAQQKYGKALTDLGTKQQESLKQQATTNLVMKQSADAAGANAREAGTAAGQQARLSAAWKDAQASLGASLLPALTALAGSLTTVTNFMTEHKTATLAIVGTVAALAVGVLAVNAGMAVYGAATAVATGITVAHAAAQKAAAASTLGTRIGLAALAVQTAVTSGVTKAAAAAQWLLNAAMTANPIGLVVLAIVALVAIFVVAYKKSETFRKIVDGAFGAIKTAVTTAVSFVVNFVKTNWPKLVALLGGPIVAAVVFVVRNWAKIKAATSAAWTAVKALVGAAINAVKNTVSNVLGGIRNAISNGWAAAKALTSAAWDAIKNVVKSGIEGVLGFLRDMPGNIRSALGDLGGLLLDAGKQIVQGLIDGIESMIDTVRGKLGDLTDMIPNWKGPRDKDRRLLRPAGRLIIGGLVRGFEDEEPTVKRALARVTETVRKGLDRARNDDRARRGLSRRELQRLRREYGALIRNGKAQDYIGKRIKAARDRLKELAKESRDYARQVREQTVAYGSVIALGQGDGFGSVEQLLSQMRARVAQARTYTDTVKKLIASGLNATTVKQLVDAGVEGGAGTAEAILSGGRDAIREINRLTKALGETGGELGKRAGRSMNAAGREATRGLIDGLQRDRNLVTRFSKQIVDGVGRRNRGAARRAGQDLARAVTRGFGEPTLTARAVASGGRGGGGGNTYNVTVNAPVGSHPAAIGEQLTKYLRAYERSGGRKAS